MLELFVLDVGRNYARVFLAKKHDFADTTLEVPVSAIKHKVEWKGPQRKHVVVRLTDSEVVQKGFSEKTAALAWMANHERVLET